MFLVIIGSMLIGLQTVVVCKMFENYFKNNARDFLKQLK